MIPKSVQRFSEKIMLKQETSVARTEGSRNPGKGVMHLIARHHGEIARARRLARARPGRLAAEPVVPLVGELNFCEWIFTLLCPGFCRLRYTNLLQFVIINNLR
jgi:hypothetical protein